jgi:hypothetical protein
MLVPDVMSQLSTFNLKSQICLFMSNKRPPEQRKSKTSPSKQRKYLAHSLDVHTLCGGRSGSR